MKSIPPTPILPKFKKGQLIVHDRFLDIAYELLNVDASENQTILSVAIYNRGWVGRPWFIEFRDVRIKKEDYDSWKVIPSLERHAEKI